MKQLSVLSIALLTGVMALPAHAQDSEREKRMVTIKIDGKDVSLPDAIAGGIDKAMEAIDRALASKELANVNVDEIRNSVRKAMEESGGNGGFVYRNYSGDRIEKGNPYSAREVREFKQTLGDGTVISRQSTRLLTRDGDGRTRQELRQPDGSARVFINDPVAKVAYIVDPQKRSACRADFNERAIHDCFTQMKGDWKPLGFGFNASGRGGIGMMRPQDDLTVEVSPNAKIIDLTRKENFKFEFFNDTPPPLPPLPPPPPLAAKNAQGASGAANTQITREKKTKQLYEGLSVDAERTVETIAAGAIGNSKAIETVYERYYSPELKMNVYVRRSDPRNGESIYRMTDIKLSDPDANAFRVPTGYSISNGKK